MKLLNAAVAVASAVVVSAAVLPSVQAEGWWDTGLCCDWGGGGGGGDYFSFDYGDGGDWYSGGGSDFSDGSGDADFAIDAPMDLVSAEVLESFEAEAAQRVEIVGQRIAVEADVLPPGAPRLADWVLFDSAIWNTWNEVALGGGGGKQGSQNARVIGKGQDEKQRVQCQVNNTGGAISWKQTLTVTESYSVSGKISSQAAAVLSAELGATIGLQFQRQIEVSAQIEPGRSLGVYVEYTTTAYQVEIAPSVFEYVNVYGPTGRVLYEGC